MAGRTPTHVPLNDRGTADKKIVVPQFLKVQITYLDHGSMVKKRQTSRSRKRTSAGPTNKDCSADKAAASGDSTNVGLRDNVPQTLVLGTRLDG
jgi:hypothetical protein